MAIGCSQAASCSGIGRKPFSIIRIVPSSHLSRLASSERGQPRTSRSPSNCFPVIRYMSHSLFAPGPGVSAHRTDLDRFQLCPISHAKLRLGACEKRSPRHAANSWRKNESWPRREYRSPLSLASEASRLSTALSSRWTSTCGMVSGPQLISCVRSVNSMTIDKSKRSSPSNVSSRAFRQDGKAPITSTVSVPTSLPIQSLRSSATSLAAPSFLSAWLVFVANRGLEYLNAFGLPPPCDVGPSRPRDAPVRPLDRALAHSTSRRGMVRCSSLWAALPGVAGGRPGGRRVGLLHETQIAAGDSLRHSELLCQRGVPVFLRAPTDAGVTPVSGGDKRPSLPLQGLPHRRIHAGLRSRRRMNLDLVVLVSLAEGWIGHSRCSRIAQRTKGTSRDGAWHATAAAR